MIVGMAWVEGGEEAMCGNHGGHMSVWRGEGGGAREVELVGGVGKRVRPRLRPSC